MAGPTSMFSRKLRRAALRASISILCGGGSPKLLHSVSLWASSSPRSKTDASRVANAANDTTPPHEGNGRGSDVAPFVNPAPALPSGVSPSLVVVLASTKAGLASALTAAFADTSIFSSLSCFADAPPSVGKACSSIGAPPCEGKARSLSSLVGAPPLEGKARCSVCAPPCEGKARSLFWSSLWSAMANTFCCVDSSGSAATSSSAILSSAVVSFHF
mmetsp:Transcript_37973/g.81144  ORF Transcript_37973/g.81144 Transcript_37973/m.81144 type:complete len:217 (-) Transcript_37973:1866-2516(-)